MPRVSHTTQVKAAGEVDRFPRLKLATGEKARIWLPEEPWMEYYHRIEAPKIEDGEVVMEVRTGKNGTYEAPLMQWIGNAFCLGKTGTPEEPGPLMLAGIDPENCPACESASRQTGVQPPQQRFACNVIKYKVRGRGQNPYDLVSPVSAEILVWAYTGRIHGMIYDLAAERDGDLKRCDVRIELEETPGADKFQKIKTIATIDKPALSDSKVRDYVVELWRDPDNRATDEQLRDACLGRDVARPVMLDMVRRAERQYRDANRDGGSGEGESSAADAGFNGGLDQGLDALLDSSPAETADHTANGATTTSTDAPAADSPSGTESPSAETANGSDPAREQAVSAAADEMFGPSSGSSEPPAPSNGNGTGRKRSAAKPPEPKQEPASVGASKGGVIDFDELFS